MLLHLFYLDWPSYLCSALYRADEILRPPLDVCPSVEKMLKVLSDLEEAA